MTKVLERTRRLAAVACCLLMTTAWAQTVPPSGNCPQTTSAMYNRLRSVELDEHAVYRVRGANLDLPNLHLVFESGTLAFTEDICGRITGALFEGDGEVLLRPPNRVERASLALFTGMAILEEQINSAYLRFNDDTAASLQPFLTPAEDSAEFLPRWGDAARGLAQLDALRLLLDFSHMLPSSTPSQPEWPRYLHAHLQGKKLGGFEIFCDAGSVEPLWAGQIRLREDVRFWDVWTSFAPASFPSARKRESGPEVFIPQFRIRASVQPPTRLTATAELDVVVRKGGERALVFELSRYLKINSVKQGGAPVDFIQNEALEGTQLRRKGNDQVALVFPAPLQANQRIKLTFSYSGEVLSEAATGLLYVGERGTWYPNFGLSPAQFDLEFEYPADWTLVATGRQASEAVSSNAAGLQVSRWTSESPTAVAGFNLGKYLRAQAMSGSVVVEAYGTPVMERSFPKPPPEIVQPAIQNPRRGIPPSPLLIVPPVPPSPARNAQAVADKAARAIDNFSQWFGPYPYSSLALTQMPGNLSQGWPGLVFLSSFAFLSPQEQTDLHMDRISTTLSNLVLAHETAHQWWGDLVLWSSYRDQWLVEGLANYSSLLVLERQNPSQFRQVLEKYRGNLLSKNKDGEWLREAGPVTLGQRLISSHFPNGYEAISYERGTWLFHMLRCMLRDSQNVSRSRNGPAQAEEPFFRGLRRVRERYAGKTMNTQQLIQIFEEELPRPLWFENRRSLDWFVDGWINGTAMPRLEAHDVRISAKQNGVLVTGTLVQKDTPDDLVTAVPVYGVTAGSASVLLGTVLADGEETSFRLNGPVGVRKIVLDPKQTILTTPK